METILAVGAVIAGTAWLWPNRAQRLMEQHATELEVLGERYATGEISRDEYLQKRDDILEYPLAP